MPEGAMAAPEEAVPSNATAAPEASAAPDTATPEEGEGEGLKKLAALEDNVMLLEEEAADRQRTPQGLPVGQSPTCNEGLRHQRQIPQTPLR